MKRALVLVTILGAVWAVAAGADGGGPSPGPSFGGPGKANATGTERYVALPSNDGTMVEAVRIRDANVMRWRYLEGTLGIPMVAYDGTLGGLSRDGRLLVLASPPLARSTTFALVDPRKLKTHGRTTLRGSWAFDALSPDGSLMYLLQYLGKPGDLAQPYAVRAFDWNQQKLLPGAIVDPREPGEKMNGQPVTRTGAPDGWTYTLYWRPNKSPFIHALDTVHRRAFCVDLPWKHPSWIYEVGLRVSHNILALRRHGLTIALMDRKSLEVKKT
jgi:hypothetical protein